MEAGLIHIEDLAMLREYLITVTSGSLRGEIAALQEQQQEALQWEQIRTHVLAAFVSPDHVEYQRTLLRQVQQHPGEGILAYNRRFREAALDAFPDPRTADQHREMVKLYGRGLKKTIDAQKLVAHDWPVTIDIAFQRMLQLETGGERFRHLERREEPMEVAAVAGKVSSTMHTSPPLVKTSETEALLKRLEQLTTKVAKLEATQNQKQATQSQNQSKFNQNTSNYQRGNWAEWRTCYYCQEKGHLKRNCQLFQRDHAEQQRKSLN